MAIKLISKRQWLALGGLRNTNLFRAQLRGKWYYYKGAIN